MANRLVDKGWWMLRMGDEVKTARVVGTAGERVIACESAILCYEFGDGHWVDAQGEPVIVTIDEPAATVAVIR